MKFSVPSCTMPLDGNCCASLIVNSKTEVTDSDGMNHDNHSCMIREMFPERVKHIQSIVDMLPRKAVPVLSLAPREICSIYRAQNDDYPQNNDRLEIQNAMVKPQRSVFKRIQNVFC